MSKNDIIEIIRQRLKHEFNPSQLNIIDESADHIGHAGARDGGHYAVEIISTSFEGKNSVERHRMIYHALGEMMKSTIHALKIQAKTPGEK